MTAAARRSTIRQRCHLKIEWHGNCWRKYNGLDMVKLGGIQVVRISRVLWKEGKISEDELCDLVLGGRAKDVAAVALKLFREVKISSSEYHRLLEAGERDEITNAKTRMREKFRDAEKLVIGRTGHHDAQAGLPSLGKRRP